MTAKWECNQEIQRFREYLRIPTVHPNVNYDECIQFLKRQADWIGLPIEIHFPTGKERPVAILTWTGAEPDLPAIVLNSHMDVVPVYVENWTHPPFSADIDDAGRIFARGSQDMKSVGMQYLEAINRLKSKGVLLKRTIHIIFVPDEEIGGDKGMRELVKTEAFRKLNVGFALDEGIASPDEIFPVFYAERSVWRMCFKCNGTSGHGSLLLENTAGEKIRRILDRVMDYRAEQVELLKNNPDFTIGDVTTVNLCILNGGIQTNVVPPELSAFFDVRLAIDVDHEAFQKMAKRWCEEAGGGIEIEFLAKRPKVPPTAIDDSNPYWKAFRETLIDDLKLQINPVVFPGRTDSCYIREIGIPALGFSPMNHTPVLLHAHDEFVFADIYLKGIAIYEKLIEKIANI